MGKYASAREKGLQMLFDPRGQLKAIPDALRETELMSIIGNLMDNAMEATLASLRPHEPIEVYIHDNEREPVIEIAVKNTPTKLSTSKT